MSLHLDPEIAAALAPMADAMAQATPPAVGDVHGRRAMWEPILAAAGTAPPIPADVTTSDHVATSSQELAGMAEQLNELVAKFTL